MKCFKLDFQCYNGMNLENFYGIVMSPIGQDDHTIIHLKSHSNIDHYSALLSSVLGVWTEVVKLRVNRNLNQELKM